MYKEIQDFFLQIRMGKGEEIFKSNKVIYQF